MLPFWGGGACNLQVPTPTRHGIAAHCSMRFRNCCPPCCHFMICRPLKPQAFEVDVGWWGAKQLNEYCRLESPALRLQACQRARRWG